MVDKLTLFELHFDGARFGPTVGEEEPTEETTDAEAAEAPSGSRTRRLLTVLATVAVVTFVGRRIARRFRGEAEIEVDAGSVESPVDQ